MDQTPNEATHLIERLRAGDRQALAELFDRYRDRLRRMVELRMDPRLRARLDASDVLQERPETAKVGLGFDAWWMGRDLSNVYKHEFSRLRAVRRAGRGVRRAVPAR